MNTRETSEIRELTVEEIDVVAGAFFGRLLGHRAEATPTEAAPTSSGIIAILVGF
jgi:hypothetical protein